MFRCLKPRRARDQSVSQPAEIELLHLSASFNKTDRGTRDWTRENPLVTRTSLRHKQNIILQISNKNIHWIVNISYVELWSFSPFKMLDCWIAGQVWWQSETLSIKKSNNIGGSGALHHAWHCTVRTGRHHHHQGTWM